ncbi:hypothetical protein BX666DRAFT_938931 [Dichotomocladium elegans]|nr:hypothetical protein BX666DRAFT_938931 [Dichotomocladium elegans]
MATSNDDKAAMMPPVLPQPPPFPNSSDVRFTTVPPEFPFNENEQKQQQQQHIQSQHSQHVVGGRGSMSVKARLALMTGVSGFWGFSIGSFLGGRQAGLQYLAENAHRLPTTVQGWYFYHKTKNYRMMLGGIKRGMVYAGRTGGLCLMYGTAEALLDKVRGEEDVANSIAAGILSGALFSTITKLTRGSARYAVMFGAAFGLAAGGLSDLHRSIAGNPPTYLRNISAHFQKED